jgi:hypothetical protein
MSEQQTGKRQTADGDRPRAAATPFRLVLPDVSSRPEVPVLTAVSASEPIVTVPQIEPGTSSNSLESLAAFPDEVPRGLQILRRVAGDRQYARPASRLQRYLFIALAVLTGLSGAYLARGLVSKPATPKRRVATKQTSAHEQSAQADALAADDSPTMSVEGVIAETRTADIDVETHGEAVQPADYRMQKPGRHVVARIMGIIEEQDESESSPDDASHDASR